MHLDKPGGICYDSRHENGRLTAMRARSFAGDAHYGDTWIARPTLLVRFYDQCLVIDGKRITFLDHLPEHTWNSYVEDVSGPGKKFIYECKTKFLGRNFYISAEETFYQK